MWNKAKLSIVLSTHAAQFNALAYQGNFEANIARIARLGYQGVELAIRDPDLVDAGRLNVVLETYGMKVPAIGTGQAWGEEHLSFTDADAEVRRKAIERIKRHIPFARHHRALVIIGLIRGVTPAGQSKDQSMIWLEECLRQCVEAGLAQGVRLAIEPLNRYETDLIPNVETGLALIERIGAANLGLLLDTFHMNIEEPSIEASIQAAGKAIFHFHVADSNRQHPGGGHLNFASILQALKSTGYQGWISGEFMPIPDPDSAAQRSISYLQAILDSG